ncbi:MAG TPA: sigma-54-dependent Fis family transcriptional regulator [Sandaracinaceae bacterium LLY-WYZ-13_1]|nr:sigma-54-dependent Fis family transcriptional regulator [Sandaracinaceae bacterium LLY-WYZ-13_1]
MPDDEAPVLTFRVEGFEPLERRLDRALSSVGSDRGADVRIANVPARWAILRQRDDGVEIRRIGVAGATLLAPGESVTLDGVELRLAAPGATAPEEGLPVTRLAEALAGAEAPDDALALLVEGLVRATGADTGAIVLRRGGGYEVPVARHADGRVLEEADELLSDTLVRDVLGGDASTLCLSDLAHDRRYASVPSVVSLKLASVLCVPMRLGDRVLGAVYLGHHDPRRRFSDAQAADLKVLATMALPVLAQLRRIAEQPASPLAEMVGECEPVAQVRDLVGRVAPSDLSVLVLGETGTGKEVTARAIHAASPRADRPMIALNCAAVPESLLAVELFGCKKGAYTGAVTDRVGRIEAADGSTLFLDEVGDMPLPMQVALLRVLEERAVTRVGENTERPVDFRLVAATSKDLDAEVEAGRFRKDLLYRLRELAVTLPPLRDRGDDVLLLARLFLRQAERQLELGGRRLSRSAERALERHAWPGNVRELRAVMRRASILCDGEVIEPVHLQLDPAPASEGQAALGSLDQPLAEARDAFVARYVRAVLNRHQGNREAAAAALGVSVRSLYRYLA